MARDDEERQGQAGAHARVAAHHAGERGEADGAGRGQLRDQEGDRGEHGQAQDAEDDQGGPPAEVPADEGAGRDAQDGRGADAAVDGGGGPRHGRLGHQPQGDAAGDRPERADAEADQDAGGEHEAEVVDGGGAEVRGGHERGQGEEDEAAVGAAGQDGAHRGGDGRDQAGDGDHEAGGAGADAELGADGAQQADGEHLGGHDDEDAEGDGGHGQPLLEGGALDGGVGGADAFEDGHGTAFRSRFSARPGWVFYAGTGPPLGPCGGDAGGVCAGAEFASAGTDVARPLAVRRAVALSGRRSTRGVAAPSRLAPRPGSRPGRGRPARRPGADSSQACGEVMPHSFSHPDERNGEHMATEGGTKAVMAALLANTGIAISKFVAAGITGSASMLAEGVHSVADASNQGLLLLGGKRAKREASPAHPFGYGRERYIYSFIVAIVLFSVGGLYALYEGYHKLSDPHELESPMVAIVVLVIAIVLEIFSLRTAVQESNAVRGRKSWVQFVRGAKSPELPVVLLEDIGALVGLIAALLGVGLAVITGEPIFDALGTIVIGVLLVVIAVVLAIETKSLLLGESATLEHIKAIEAAILEGEEITDIIHLKTLHIGPDELLVAAKIGVQNSESGEQIAAEINAAEDRIRAAVPIATRIYLEPDLRRESAE